MQFKIKDARLSFPNLFQTATFSGDDTGKYDATLILDKIQHKKLIEDIQAAFALLCKENLKCKALPPERYCLKDGDLTERPELEGKYSLRASTKKRPLVIGRDKTPLTEEDGIIYAGCYVNAIISLWTQNNDFGKRINANLDGIQFWRNGEPFGTAGVDVDEFDAFGPYDGPEDEAPF